MALKGGSDSTVPPPPDGDHVARVIPLRRRGIVVLEPPEPREPLEAENAPFDPEMELCGVRLRKRRTRRLTAPFASLRARRPAEVIGWRGIVVGILAATAVGTGVLALGRSPASVRSAVRSDHAPVPVRDPLGDTRTLSEQLLARIHDRAFRRAAVRRVRSHHHVAAVAGRQRSAAAPKPVTGPADQSPSQPSTSQPPPAATTPVVTSVASSAPTAARSSSSTEAFGAAGALGPGSSPNG
jgi:hypothetical protein